MQELVAEFTDYLVKTRNYSTHTADAYSADLADFEHFWIDFNGGNLTLTDLSGVDTLGFRAWLADRQRRGLSFKSTARALSSLRGFYKYLAKHYGIKNNAIGLISSPKIPKKLSKAIDASDVADMQDAIRVIDDAEPWIAARDWALVTLLFGCGLRISEALSITNADVAGAPDTLRIVG